MQYSIATLAALATAVLAVQPHFTNTAFDVVEGTPFTISFDGCADGCTIVLQNGESKDLKDYKTLTASAEGGSFTFTPTDLPTDKYNFKITDNDSGEFNYSDQFSYEGEAVATTETSSAVSTTKAATSTTEKATSTTEEATSTTEKATTSTSKAVSTTEKATTLTKAVSTPSRNNTTPVSSAASSTEDSSSTATEESTSTAAETTAATTVPDSGAARISSSIALIAGAVMAMVYLN